MKAIEVISSSLGGVLLLLLLLASAVSMTEVVTASSLRASFSSYEREAIALQKPAPLKKKNPKKGSVLRSAGTGAGRSGGSSKTCTYIPQSNITTGASSSSQFVDSETECCALCTSTNGCQASVFANYLCTLYNNSNIEPGTGTVCLIYIPTTAAPPTPVPTTTMAPPTPVPTPAPPTTPTPPTPNPITPAPPTPVPTTGSPTRHPNASVSHGLVYRDECTQTSQCNITQDESCTTTVYKTDECYSYTDESESWTWKCFPQFGYAEKKSWGNKRCSGTPSSATQHELNRCYKDQNSNYRQNLCGSVDEINDVSVVRSSCYKKDMTQCNNVYFKTGYCYGTNSVESGTSMLVYHTNDGYIWFRTYDAGDCTGPYKDTRATQLNLKYEDDNNNWIIWSITESNAPITEAPLPNTSPETLGLLERDECTQTEQCSRLKDESCRTTAYKTDRCYNLDGTGTMHQCFPGFGGIITTYPYTNCTGLPTSNVIPIENQCYRDQNSNYRRNRCSVVQKNKNYLITRQSCQNGPGKQCDTVEFFSGKCNNVQSTESGCGMIPYCGGPDDNTFVWFVSFDACDCTGDYQYTRTNPLGITYEDDNNNYITWKCKAQ